LKGIEDGKSLKGADVMGFIEPIKYLERQKIAELRRIAEDEGVDLDDLSDEEIKKEYEDLLGNVSEDEHSKKEKLTWSNGHFYEGELVNGKPHGIGKLTSPSGLVYEGKWVDGLFEGNDT
jgi:hypothetical protein